MFETSANRNAPNNGQPEPKVSACVHKCHVHDMRNGSRNTHTLAKALSMPREETDQFGNQ
jgi:endonuclease IV